MARKQKPALDRAALARVIAVINGKGGTGKTSTVANVGGLLAAGGMRVLLVDMDPQFGGLRMDLGLYGGEHDDDGRSLAASLTYDMPLQVVRNVRPNLDVIVGGDELHKVQSAIVGGAIRDEDPRLLLARSLAHIAGAYDLVLIDCPPGEDALQVACIGAAAWLLVPFRGDEGSAMGMAGVASRRDRVLDANPTVRLLGVTLFDVDTTATRVKTEAKLLIHKIFGRDDLLLDTVIRHSSTVMQQARKHRRLVTELADSRGEQVPWYDATPEQRANAITPTMAKVAGDYKALTLEILDRLETKTKEVAQ